ncbi:hypothetical protein [Flammeovirga kamogawensis]|uniref:DUF4625 domain-containing protein n=1 Tax=Flammeovirga kamogawensis TaxID=373891 RepID=A0ABX8H4R2_9BACT|nr:hypothetical protein [Flammeovirga kamogawensis]MBB6463503.1 hypothetical protein [Flammeovirga kamogawensis]QWG10562.1 hypothetical protein KM029_24575 [Flammeovirga kamogawensis]TRX63669.1 hypothetical protein EO216_24965 [Flammeovirga kamogawensis]
MKKIIQFIILICTLWSVTSCSQHDVNNASFTEIKDMYANVTNSNQQSHLLEVIADIQYLEMGYIKVDIHPLELSAMESKQWRASFIYDQFDEGTFHAQYSIPEYAKGEYQIVLNVVEKNNSKAIKKIDTYID